MYYENVLRWVNGLPLRMAYQEVNGVTTGAILDPSGKLAPMPANLQTQYISMPVIHVAQVLIGL